MDGILSGSALFAGIPADQLTELLQCLGGIEKQFARGCTIFQAGTVPDQLGLVLKGRVLVQCCDAWGNLSVLGSASPGETFGEAYACCPGEPLQISVQAAEDTTALFLNASRVLTVCPASCPFHARLVRNLLEVCARKNLMLSRRMLHITPKTIRGRLLSYFSQCARQAKSPVFTLEYNRQQLADHLGVDRSAMCSELSKMQADGLVRCTRRQVEILGGTEELP